MLNFDGAESGMVTSPGMNFYFSVKIFQTPMFVMRTFEQLNLSIIINLYQQSRVKYHHKDLTSK